MSREVENMMWWLQGALTAIVILSFFYTLDDLLMEVSSLALLTLVVARLAYNYGKEG